MKKLIAVLVGVLLLLPSLTMALEPFNKDLRYGMTKNAEVKRMQEFLRDEGLYKGAITGNYYALTRQSVRDLQKREGLKITGVFDKATREVLNSRSEEVVISNEDNWLDEWVKNTPPISPVVVSNQQPSVVINNPQPFVPTPTPIIFTDTSTITPTGSPTGTTMDTTAPRIVFDGRSMVNIIPPFNVRTSGGSNEVVFGRSSLSYGNIQNGCMSCIVILTDEPTTLNLEYTDFFNDSDFFDISKSYNDKIKILNLPLNTNHIVMLKTISSGWPNKIFYKLSIKDGSGNEYKKTDWVSASYDPKLDESYIRIDNVKTIY